MLATILGLLQLVLEHAPEEQALIAGGVEVYRQLRDAGAAEPDSLTDPELAQLLKDKGAAISVEADHWLAKYGFAE